MKRLPGNWATGACARFHRNYGRLCARTRKLSIRRSPIKLSIQIHRNPLKANSLKEWVPSLGSDKGHAAVT